MNSSDSLRGTAPSPAVASATVQACFDELLREGYTIVKSALSRDRCETALRAVDALKQRHGEAVRANANEHGYLYRIVNLHLALDELADIFTDNESALGVCDRFFGEPTSLYTSLYFERGSEQPLHRDTPYFATKPAGRYLGLWTALDDVDDSNGPLRVVPRSHALPPLDVAAMGRKLFPAGMPVPGISNEAWVHYQDAVQQQCAEAGLSPIDVHVDVGDAIIWHPELLHGGAPHRVPARSRRSLVCHVTPVGVPVYHLDVFFDPQKQVPDRASFPYLTRNERKIARFDRVDFGHQYELPLAALR